MGRPAFSGRSTHARKRASQAAIASWRSVRDRPSKRSKAASSSGMATGAAAGSLRESGS